MPGRNLHDVVLRAAGVPGRIRPASDGDLLGWFVAERDAAAFAELVRRHGSMVLGVARRELGNTPDADDACQATFLVLARKAAAVRRGDAVGAWLYGVARRVARKAQRKRLASRERERPESYLESTPSVARAPGSHDPPTRAALSELLRVLDEELGRLPDAYRAPLVLCYLEGRTQDEAARQLGWSLGSFRGRLERGRAHLRDRLTRRGVGLAVLAAAAVARPASVAAAVQSSIINTAAAVAAGEALTIPAAVAALAEGAMRTMIATKLQCAAGVFAVCGMLTVGGVWATGQGPGTRTPAPVQPAAGAKAKAETPVQANAITAQRQQCLLNLRRIMLAIHNFHDANGHLPADILNKNGQPILSWRVAILPFMEQDALYSQFHLDEPWDSKHNLNLLQNMPATYRVGIERKNSTHTYYQAFAGPGTPLHPTVRAGGQRRPIAKPGGGEAGREAGPTIRIPADFVDGASNTFGVVEAGTPVPWSKPADIPFDPKEPLKLVTPFANEWHVVMMDGSARALKRDIDPDVLRRLIIMNDGEQTPPLNELAAPPLPTETPKRKRDLQKQVAENQRMIDFIRRLMTEHADLLALQNRSIKDLGQASENGERLGKIVDELTARNKKIREDLGLPANNGVQP